MGPTLSAAGPTTARDDDDELMYQIQGGDRQAFDRLVERYQGSLSSFFFRHLRDWQLAEDLTQETFIRVWKHIAEARQVPMGRRRFWLFALARSAACDHARRRLTRKNLENPLPSSELAQTDLRSNPEAVFNAGEVRAALEMAVRRLPENLRIALTMQAIGGMTSAEIGETLGIPAGTVRFRISLARKRLAADPGLIAATEEKERRD